MTDLDALTASNAAGSATLTAHVGAKLARPYGLSEEVAEGTASHHCSDLASTPLENAAWLTDPAADVFETAAVSYAHERLGRSRGAAWFFGMTSRRNRRRPDNGGTHRRGV